MTKAYVHSVPGRLRIKTPAMKRNKALISDVTGFLSTMAGVVSTTANETIGSLVINYDRDTTTKDRIISNLQRKGYADFTNTISNDELIKDGITKAGKFVTKMLTGSAFDSALSGTPLSFLSLII
ncbi:MAG: hypothetical protein HQK89_09275 [Nitrospirae bacterium]|nr:hypothetical protein [Nitrospirota bacterium]